MKLRCFLTAAWAALLVAPTALAVGGAGGAGYGGSGGSVQNEVSQGALNTAGTGTLPFTGLDLALLVIGGITLLIVGAGLRRAAKRGT